jgi:hypothetical protein
MACRPDPQPRLRLVVQIPDRNARHAINDCIAIIDAPACSVTDQHAANADPELAVLSAMAHGRDADAGTALKIALVAAAASVGLDAERSILNHDLVLASLSKAAKRALQAMDPAKYKFQSEFAKRYFSQGKAEGKAEVVLNLLALKFRKVSAATKKRVQSDSTQELDRYAERILTAKSLGEVFKKR